ncbi:hypothetical protein D6D15_04518 [Aureobasidium pullulans]|uniref:NCS1 nucleoside transporter family n=1 Tax=Aureobasidium pullulans TaxID=5580 RepID=A0A4S9BC10_AURPU|nr:hypothetical protein D6D15_04518 [Aureobasidium pullulans]
MVYSDVKGDASGEVSHTVEPVQMGDSSAYKRRFTGFKLAVDQEPSSFATNPNASNADFDPIPPSNRTWTWKAYVAYWMADAWAVSNWEVASSMIAGGLSWRMAIGACVLGNFIMGAVITMNGRIGAHLHVPFPIIARVSFGYYFSYFVVVSRCALAIIWLGVQTVTGGQCMEVLLTAIWPSYANIPNHIAAGQGIDTKGMCAFVLYFLLQVPFLCIPYTKVQYFFGFKSIIAPIIFLAVFGHTLHKAGGTVSASPVITEGPTVKGSILVWAFFSNLNSVLGNYSTLGLNIADFARYANKRSAQNCQAFVIPFIFTIVGLLGIFTAAASSVAYPEEVAKAGTPLWNPVTIVGLWSASGSSAGRAASAFGAIGLIIVTLGINISANSISAANDLVSFFPKYINIRRGQLLAALIGAWACVPWKILASAQKFLSFLSGYTIFLGPMTAIIMVDYYITRRGNVSVPDMYRFDGIYRYSPKFGTNWRAVVALVVGFLPPLPGFANSIDQGKLGVSLEGQHIFAIGYMYSFVAAGLCYWALMRFAPEHESRMDHEVTGEDILVANDGRKGRYYYKDEKKGFSVRSWVSRRTNSDSSVA